MDEVVVALQPAKDTLTTAYDRVLRQRNRLLKEWEGAGAPLDLATWDQQLIDAGSPLIEARRDAVERLTGDANGWFEHLAGYGLEMSYQSSVPLNADLAASFRARLEERRRDELQRRTSLVGPHRDDLSLVVRDMGARSFGSHGEMWAAALCLRLAEADAVRTVIGEPPLLLIDDPYSALDPQRRDRLAERLAATGGQVVISVADEADVPAKRALVLDVAAGRVTRRSAS